MKKNYSILDLHKFLYDNEMSICSVESCTGGAIGDLLTSQSGSSQYYLGGLIVYAEAMKTKLLDIPRDYISRYGVVSEEIALAMAKKGVNKINSHFSISSTGYSEVSNYPHIQNPFAYIGLYSKQFSKVYKIEFEGSRSDAKKFYAKKSVELMASEIDIHWGLD